MLCLRHGLQCILVQLQLVVDSSRLDYSDVLYVEVTGLHKTICLSGVYLEVFV